MDRREIGQLFIVGFTGTAPDTGARRLLEHLNPAGVILFSRNVEDPRQVARLNNELQRFAHEKLSAPLLISVDQEGGRVARLREPFTAVPPALQIAQDPDPEKSVAQYADVMARELALAGFNLDFAPVMDVLSFEQDLESTVIGDRSYGTNPTTVSRLAVIAARSLRRRGVIPCGKHFPGHGGTLVDSHKDLPVDERTREELDACDLKPFHAAVTEGLEIIMTAHVLYPKLDPDLPAGLSKPVITGLLREEWNYQGVVITDDLDMGAVTGLFTAEECCVRALKAGTDLLLICNHPEKAFSARDAIARALSAGELPEARIREAIQRTATIKRAFADTMRPCDVAALDDYFRGIAHV